MDIAQLSDRILNADRRALARAITLVESARADHRAHADELLSSLTKSGRQALRIGMSGTPGVGKSTFAADADRPVFSPATTAAAQR